MAFTTWYMEAVNDDPQTNNYLVLIVGAGNGEYLHEQIWCADGIRRNLFECPKGYMNVRSAIAAISDFNLKLEIYRKIDDGSITHYVLWKKAIRKKARICRLLGKGSI